MTNETTLLGWFKYTSKKDMSAMVCFTVLAQPIPEVKGSGYFTKNFYVSESAKLHEGVKAGKVRIETNAWNSNVLEKIENI